MAENGESKAAAPADLKGLEALVARAGEGRGTPPVEQWNPPFCGNLDMEIAADGTWFYAGTPIARPAMVQLFAGILRKDPERYVLVTPVECVGIAVEDDGPGIPAAERSRVTDAFYRILGTEQQGTGLGLSIADAIAKEAREIYRQLDAVQGGTREIKQLRQVG